MAEDPVEMSFASIMPWVLSNTNLPPNYPSRMEDPSSDGILYEALHCIDTAYYDRVPNGEVYVESDKRTYKSNSIGHTGPEPGKVDTLFLGCSVTSGIGLDFEQTWGYRVAQKLGGSYTSLAYVGGSISKILRNATEYILKYGKPKRILFLAPDTFRFDVYIPPLPSTHGYHLSNGEDLVKKVQNTNLIYARDPVGSSKILDSTLVHQLSLASLHQFIRLCSLLDIDFQWATWSPLPSKIGPLYDSYVSLDIDYVSPKDFYRLECHSNDANEENFLIASDNDHFGSHFHIHVAEAFISAIS